MHKLHSWTGGVFLSLDEPCAVNPSHFPTSVVGGMAQSWDNIEQEMKQGLEDFFPSDLGEAMMYREPSSGTWRVNINMALHRFSLSLSFPLFLYRFTLFIFRVNLAPTRATSQRSLSMPALCVIFSHFFSISAVPPFPASFPWIFSSPNWNPRACPHCKSVERVANTTSDMPTFD